MAEPYLSELRAIVGMAGLRPVDAISCKHFLSGAAACVDGDIFMTLTPVGLALKLPEHDRTALFDQGWKLLRYFPAAPVKKDYALLPSKMIDDGGVLKDWVSRSIEFVRN
jgi:TfoX/Sxy family transcriptional regulator of competence genes